MDSLLLDVLLHALRLDSKVLNATTQPQTTDTHTRTLPRTQRQTKKQTHNLKNTRTPIHTDAYSGVHVQTDTITHTHTQTQTH